MRSADRSRDDAAAASSSTRPWPPGIAVSDDTYRDATSIRLFVWALIQAMQVGWGDDFKAVADDAWDFCSRAARDPPTERRVDAESALLQDVTADP